MIVVGRKSPHSLYRHELATYEEGDQYDATAAMGFIKIHGLGQTTQAKHQLLNAKAGGRPPGTPEHHPAGPAEVRGEADQLEGRAEPTPAPGDQEIALGGSTSTPDTFKLHKNSFVHKRG